MTESTGLLLSVVFSDAPNSILLSMDSLPDCFINSPSSSGRGDVAVRLSCHFSTRELTLNVVFEPLLAVPRREVVAVATGKTLIVPPALVHAVVEGVMNRFAHDVPAVLVASFCVPSNQDWVISCTASDKVVISPAV